MAKFRVQLLGQFAAWRDETLITGLESVKARELFCYLLLHRHRTHPREILIEVLWSDSSATQARKSLRQALWQLHTALHPGYESKDDEVLTVEGDTISVNPHADLWLDVDVFERAYAQARGQQGREGECSAKHGGTPDYHVTRMPLETLAVAGGQKVGDAER